MVTMTYDHDNEVFKIDINGILDYQTSKNFNLKLQRATLKALGVGRKLPYYRIKWIFYKL